MQPIRTLIVFAALAVTGTSAVESAAAGTINSPVCKRELAQTWTSLKVALRGLDGLADMAQEQKCAAISNQREAATAAREVFARCHTGEDHTRALRNVDDVLEETRKSFNRQCPPRPGLIRINAVFTTRIAPSAMPEGVRKLHRCTMGSEITFMNEAFDDGRIMLAGCIAEDINEAEAKRRNMSAETSRQSQVQIYHTLDSTGRGARRLSFPVRGADGGETSVDMLPQTGTMPTGRNIIAANWKPAQADVCRIHAEWRVDDGKADLVLWQEVVDCSKSGPPEYRTVLDRREQK